MEIQVPIGVQLRYSSKKRQKLSMRLVILSRQKCLSVHHQRTQTVLAANLSGTDIDRRTAHLHQSLLSQRAVALGVPLQIDIHHPEAAMLQGKPHGLDPAQRAQTLMLTAMNNVDSFLRRHRQFRRAKRLETKYNNYLQSGQHLIAPPLSFLLEEQKRCRDTYI